ncbi:metallophosphoesterase family protein [Clostridium magnum]|uniref:3',5'-cyclic adenosine monophosphate phosphodiesterase CpdA n=1 Tax=Clostridium magnum DSM 2767 TaxID=1121326 RepID=A0A161WFK4_9CLOT|nr:metallophosphoesterase [Clostridium magnum]KZL90445.1 3',5'-cyclic adenosine monophosphate phosphodiesterase CpdA [Clostridium magnum DSM 2767]SHH85340.1 3',5'-cyclic AMP phosphodiesterase CpdA [Clostridium magnum DSM 2767]
MKKIKIIIITIIVILLSVMSAIYIYKPRPITKATATVKSNADLAFAVLGDVHGNIDSFQRSINDLYRVNPDIDALVLNGDTVDQGIEEQYDSVKKALSENKYLLPETIIKNIGNHEFFNYDAGTNSSQQVQVFINRYLEFAGEEKVYHDTWVKGYHFISLGSEDGNSKTLDSIKAFISKEQQNWFKEKLTENYQKGKPIFVFLHQPLGFKYGNKTYVGVEQSDQIKEILSKYPEVILFSSHTHRDLDENSIVLNSPFTMINTGAVGYTLIPDESSQRGMRRESSYIKGLYIEVNGNKVIVKGRNIKEEQWIFTKEFLKE